MTLLASSPLTVRLVGKEAIEFARKHDLKLHRLAIGDEPARDDITVTEALGLDADTLYIDVDRNLLPIVAVSIAAIHANAAILLAMQDADTALVLAKLADARARIVAQVMSAPVFDVARLTAARAALDQEIARLSAELPPAFAQSFKAALELGDKHAAEQARSLLGQSMPAPSQYALDLRGIQGVVVSPGQMLRGPSAHLAEFAAQQSADLAKQITFEARSKINRILTAGATGFSSTQDIRDALGDVLADADRPVGFFGKLATQVDGVHRTKTGELYEWASRERMSAVAEASPFEMGKMWLAVLGRVWPRDHQSMHGTIVGMDEQFVTPYGNKCDGPLDAALPAVDAVSCRCSLAAVRLGRKAGR